MLNKIVMLPQVELHSYIGGGTPGEPSEAMLGLIENATARIDALRAEGQESEADGVQEQLDRMQEIYADTGRIDLFPVPSGTTGLLENIATAPPGGRQ